ncbi:lysophospholipase [Pseudoalteromonas sp. SMS1]|uniref:alpha/beta hydrolase n=1 Tax=Pseudoalteromonas sp. SMS1 TaxID=2908894 RepID=UPI001F2929EE|nr:alpha/beta fold hydrolase [Pseudoalteromonas sp. SMS1]MCF2858529.1 lysophospholipase [Pseudoalteromonas sp. SMS1]
MFRLLRKIMLKKFIGLIAIVSAAGATAQDCTTLPANHQLFIEGKQSGEYRVAHDLGDVSITVSDNLTFAQYVKKSRALISARNKRAQLPCPLPGLVNMQHDATRVVDHLAPYQMRQANNEKAVLLIHGLTDSPYIFNAIANDLYRQGFNVRSMLLPGHATAADDLRRVSNKDWHTHVQYAIARTAADFKQFAIMGFSTGAALATIEVAHTQPKNLTALVLVAPATASHNKKSWMAQWVDWVPWMDWLDQDADLDFAKYESFPLAAAALVHNVMVEMMDTTLPDDLPILTIMSDVDATINSQATLRLLNRWAKNHTAPIDLRLYSQNGMAVDERINVTQISQLENVVDMSHVGLLLPQNHPYYGRHGSYRHCGSYFENEAAFKVCKTAPNITFGEHHDNNKAMHQPLARVTFNPDYAGLRAQLMAFLESHIDKS